MSATIVTGEVTGPRTVVMRSLVEERMSLNRGASSVEKKVTRNSSALLGEDIGHRLTLNHLSVRSGTEAVLEHLQANDSAEVVVSQSLSSNLYKSLNHRLSTRATLQ